jgi:group II intron reverse transcriptase/maturase
MLSPQEILISLKKRNKSDNKYRKLYKNLYNLDFYKLAYSNIYTKPSQMTKASDDSTIDGMSIDRINKLIEKLRNRSYRPTDLRRIYIQKKNDKTRPISISSFEDKLIQEIIKLILEAIYDDNFSEYSHGFRPNKSCHSALEQIRQKFKGTSWFIEGDIKSCFDSIDHVILLNILKEKIKDDSFIHLINLFLKSGYLENQVYHKTYSGTPQGSIISPILCNIYLDKFDKLMDEFKQIYEKDSKKLRHVLPEYRNITNNIYRMKQNLSNNINIIKSKEKLSNFQKQQKHWVGSTVDMMDSNYRRFHYVRYVDDFLIGIIGPKSIAIKLKNKLIEWFKKKLKLELSEEKTKISHNSEKIRFLGYDIISIRNSQNKRENGNIKLSVPYDIMIDFMLKNRIAKWWNSPISGKDELKAIHKSELINNDPYEILLYYGSKLKGLYQYYKLAENVYKLGNFNYLFQTSYLRTLSAKYRTSRAKLYKNKKFYRNKTLGYFSQDKNKFYKLFNGPFEKQLYKDKDICEDKLINFRSRNSLIKRMEANKCEHCGNTDGPFEVHHVKKLKDISKNKENWAKNMIFRHRKTLILCLSCHHKLHVNKL